MPKNSAAGGIWGGFTASKIRRLIWRAVIFSADKFAAANSAIGGGWGVYLGVLILLVCVWWTVYAHADKIWQAKNWVIEKISSSLLSCIKVWFTDVQMIDGVYLFVQNKSSKHCILIRMLVVQNLAATAISVYIFKVFYHANWGRRAYTTIAVPRVVCNCMLAILSDSLRFQ